MGLALGLGLGLGLGVRRVQAKGGAHAGASEGVVPADVAEAHPSELEVVAHA